MKFKGDIIITDPCYIMKDERDYQDLATKPKWETFHTCKYKDDPDLFIAESKEKDIAYGKWYEKNEDHFEVCNYGNDMEALGINKYITRDTLYGDWSCTTFNTDTKDILGRFCADAGKVSVFLLEEVLKYNPKFDYHINKPHTTTLIKDFDGDIVITTVDVKPDPNDEEYETCHCDYEDREVRVIGKGNINFYTTQSGF